MASSTGESLEATMRPRALLSVYDKTGIIDKYNINNLVVLDEDQLQIMHQLIVENN